MLHGYGDCRHESAEPSEFGIERIADKWLPIGRKRNRILLKGFSAAEFDFRIVVGRRILVIAIYVLAMMARTKTASVAV